LELNKMINVSFWTRTVCLTVTLWLAFQLGFLRAITPNSPIHNISVLNAFISVFLFVWAAPSSVYRLVAQIWNKITPLRDKPTIIENEIVYILSVLCGITLFSAIFLNITLKDIPKLITILTIASLPGSLCAYILQRMNMQTLFAAQKEEVIVEKDDIQGFDPSSLNILAYLAVATIFTLTLAISVCLVIYLRVEFQLDKFIPIAISIFTTCGFFTLLLTIFGHIILPFGVKVKTKLNMAVTETRVGIASTWFLGLMTIVTIFLIIFGGFRAPRSLDAFLSSWHLVVTYILFCASAFVAGLALKSFYKPKPISAVFT
jgi:hypothetical protein